MSCVGVAPSLQLPQNRSPPRPTAHVRVQVKKLPTPTWQVSEFEAVLIAYERQSAMKPPVSGVETGWLVTGLPQQIVLASGRLSLKLPRHLVRQDALQGAPIGVTLGVRPEDVALTADGEAATVKVVEPTGHESSVFFDLLDHTVVGRVGPDIHLRPGEAVRLTFNSAKLHVFADSDGKRLLADLSPVVAKTAPNLVA